MVSAVRPDLANRPEEDAGYLPAQNKVSMKLFEVAEKARDSGEYILGARETGSHACYMVYGLLKPGEKGRELRPGHGHEEIVLAVTGDLRLTGHHTGTLKQGQALHLSGEESVFVENPGTSQALYVIAGGHASHGHHE